MALYIASQDKDLAPSSLHIPDMLAGWPWQRKINPFYEEVSAESNAWLRSLSPFTAKSQHAFERCNFGLLTSLMFPDVPRDQLRTAADLMNSVFALDEYTDIEDAPTVRAIVEICADAMHNPGQARPCGETSLGEIFRQFWERGRRTVPDQTLNVEPFVASLIDYMNGVVAQAEARDQGRSLTIDAFLAIRREDIGVRPFLALGALFLSIPDYIYDDPHHAQMIVLSCDLVGIDNDMISYNREQATGHSDFNYVTLTMQHRGLALHDAARWTVKENAEFGTQFLQYHSEFFKSRGGKLDGNIQAYIDHVGNMRRASWCWSFECGRYFGDNGATYAKTEITVPLISKKVRDANLHGNQIEVYLMEEGLASM